jgi:hypothetical protein
MADYIPLVTHDYKVAFCQATDSLPNDVKQIIWKNLLEINTDPKPPGAPIKPSMRLDRLMAKWKKNRKHLNF